MGDDDFSNARFNGCLGRLEVTDNEIAFQDAGSSAPVSLSWGLGALVEVAVKPKTFSVDLSFDMEGIKERASFEMISFAEMARFRSSVTQHRKAYKWHGSDLEADSVSSAKTFQHDEDTVASGVSSAALGTSAVQLKTFQRGGESMASGESDATHVPSAGQPRGAEKNQMVAQKGASRRRTFIAPTNEISVLKPPDEPNIPLVRGDEDATDIQHEESRGQKLQDSNPIKIADPMNDSSANSDLGTVSEHSHAARLARERRKEKELEKSQDRETRRSSYRTQEQRQKQRDEELSATTKSTEDEVPILDPEGKGVMTEEEIVVNDEAAMETSRVAIQQTCGHTTPAPILAVSQRDEAAMETSRVGAVFEYPTRQPDQRMGGGRNRGSVNGDPAERSMLDFSGTSPHNRTSTMTPGTIVEATLVQGGSFIRSDPQPPESVVASPDISQESRRKKLYILVGIVGCFSIAILIVVLVMSSITAGSDESGVTSDWEKEMSPEELFSLLEQEIQSVVYDRSSLDDDSSPQSKALYWMAFEDTLSRGLSKEGRSERIRQRYLLSVVYFSMTQEKRLAHCRPPETGEPDTCIHQVLESYSTEGVYFDQRMQEPAFRWLSVVDECRWAGIICTDGDHVSKFNLAGYGLQSTLPIELGYLSHLQLLDLQLNEIYGPLPFVWGEVGFSSSPMESIHLDRNKISGKLPDQWCNINPQGLREMVVSNNALFGTLPSCWGASLENFSVMHNSMSGKIPSSISNLTNLQRLQLAGNRFNGQVPESFCALKEGEEQFWASADCENPASEDYVECSCCTTCCDGDGSMEDCNLKLADTVEEGWGS